MGHHSLIRWYNPTLEDFEWREVPPTDEQALELLDGSPYSATCTQTYREWRQLGASIGAALIHEGGRGGPGTERGREAGGRRGTLGAGLGDSPFRCNSRAPLLERIVV